MKEAETRGMDYLFKFRRTTNVKRLVETLFRHGQWSTAGHGWQGAESLLKLSGWSRYRRVMVLRRELKGKVLPAHKRECKQEAFAFFETA